MPLLLDTGEFCVSLIDDHVQQRVAHLLRGNLAQVFPFAIALEVAELDFLGLNGAEESVKREAGDFVAVDANLFAPLVKKADPIREGADFCHFARHVTKTPSSQ